MVGRFAKLWLTQVYRKYNFDEVVEQLSILWANALGIKNVETWSCRPSPGAVPATGLKFGPVHASGGARRGGQTPA